MKAENKPRLDKDHKDRLEDHIPLEMPWLLFVDPSGTCNLRCQYCPTGPAHRKENRIMPWYNYQKIIFDLQQWPYGSKLKTLRLYKDGEPLMNQRFADMVKYAKDKNITEKVDTTTNGSLLNVKRNRELIASGIDRIIISVNGLSRQDYIDFCQYPIQWERYVQNIYDLYEQRGKCEIFIKLSSDHLTPKQHKYFFELFGDHADRVFLEHTAPIWIDHTPQGVHPTKGIYGDPLKDVQVCPYIFYSLSINSNLAVSLCFVDWDRKLIIGDLNKEGLKDVWHGETLRQIRYKHLTGKRSECNKCDKCQQLRHGSPTMLDHRMQEYARYYEPKV